uniref:Uncharacterized protein n=1 Tax=Timema shepardi TaxID=629360 RepID=A0A7R9G049_TIMSH|nr:unnamed protein product [Timema shepardi]
MFSATGVSVLSVKPTTQPLLRRVASTEIRTSISPSLAVELNTTSALANYATETDPKSKGLDYGSRILKYPRHDVLASKVVDLMIQAPWMSLFFVTDGAELPPSTLGAIERVCTLKLDGVAHTGSRSSDHQLSVLQNLTDLLRHTFSSQFVFPVLGHEDPNPALGQSYREVADLWRHWLPTEALHTFNKGGYYTIEQKIRKLRLVAINTNLYTGLGGDEEDPKDQWAWLETVLDTSRRNKETVYLVGHIPPGVDERQSGAFLSHQAAFLERFNTRYLLLVRKYSDVIVGQFFGHLHSDSFRVVYKNNGRPVSWMFISPAVSPRRTPSGANNPGLRLYKFDTDTGQTMGEGVGFYSLFLDPAAPRDTVAMYHRCLLRDHPTREGDYPHADLHTHGNRLFWDPSQSGGIAPSGRPRKRHHVPQNTFSSCTLERLVHFLLLPALGQQPHIEDHRHPVMGRWATSAEWNPTLEFWVGLAFRQSSQWLYHSFASLYIPGQNNSLETFLTVFNTPIWPPNTEPWK